eukprot:scaffold1805_cov167-Ochromonas_danica.AAC.6
MACIILHHGLFIGQERQQDRHDPFADQAVAEVVDEKRGEAHDDLQCAMRQCAEIAVQCFSTRHDEVVAGVEEQRVSHGGLTARIPSWGGLEGQTALCVLQVGCDGAIDFFIPEAAATATCDAVMSLQVQEGEVFAVAIHPEGHRNDCRSPQTASTAQLQASLHSEEDHQQPQAVVGQGRQEEEAAASHRWRRRRISSSRGSGNSGREVEEDGLFRSIDSIGTQWIPLNPIGTQLIPWNP